MKQQYIFCRDLEYVEKLEFDNFKVVDKHIVDNEIIYVLLPPNNKKFDKLDLTKCFFSDKKFF